MNAKVIRTKPALSCCFNAQQPSAQINAKWQEAQRLKEQIAALERENAYLKTLPEPRASSVPATPMATRLRTLLSVLFDHYESSRGISCDAYFDTPQWHAMAEAQYLEAVVIARQAELLSESQATLRAKASIARLRSGAVRHEAGVFVQWGLGFPWQHFSADEPFLVTTALVTRALLSADMLVPCTDFVRQALGGLARLPRREVSTNSGTVALPVYAPSLPEVVENTVAVWAQVVVSSRGLSILQPETVGDAEKALSWLDQRFMPGLGWTYSAARPVFDLMHQVYIIEALLRHRGPRASEQRAIETFAAFRAGAGYIDSMLLTDRTKAIKSAERSGMRYVVFSGKHVLTAQCEPARLWSLGGMLGCFGLLAIDGALTGYWLSQIRHFPMHMLPSWLGTDFRQEMHLARGIAHALMALKRQHSARAEETLRG
jgi:hypothetical protein